MPKTILQRFNEKWLPHPRTSCWNWTAATNPSGYGNFHVDGAMRSAHRVSYNLHAGVIPEGEGQHGTCVLHRCDNRRCVNPDHLFLGSNAENMADCKEKGRRPRGETHSCAKLTDGDVLAIREDCRPLREISSDYGVSTQHIWLIKKRRTRSHT